MRQQSEWSQAEEDRLRFLYPHVTAKEAARRLGRSRAAVKAKARALGLAVKRLDEERAWSCEALDLLRDLYAHSTNEEIAAHLGRTPRAVRHQAVALGLAKGDDLSKVRWTDEECAVMREIFPETSDADIAKRLGRSVPAVRHQAAAMGLRKAPWYRFLKGYPPELRELAMLQARLEDAITRRSRYAKQAK